MSKPHPTTQALTDEIADEKAAAIRAAAKRVLGQKQVAIDFAKSEVETAKCNLAHAKDRLRKREKDYKQALTKSPDELSDEEDLTGSFSFLQFPFHMRFTIPPHRIGYTIDYAQQAMAAGSPVYFGDDVANRLVKKYGGC